MKRLIFALALLLALQSLGAGRAVAQPALPSSFYGTVTYENAPILAGIPVTAWIDGVPYTTTYTLLDAGLSVYRINIQADNPFTAPIETGEEMEGKAIEFRVNNNIIKDINPIWQSGTNVLLDLAYFDNRIPVANNMPVIVTPPDSVTFTLEASDEDGDTLTYQYSNPSQGSLTGTPPTLIYTPNTGYVSPDTFTFKVWDGEDWSNEATVFLRTNEAPQVNTGEITTPEDSPIAINLGTYASDLDGDPLSYEILEIPINGSLSGVVPNLTYTPKANYPGSASSGTDSFRFEACDPFAACADAVITLTISQVNDPPMASNITVDVFINSTKNEINLLTDGSNYFVSDWEGHYVTWEIDDQPEHGELLPKTGSIYKWLYTPDIDFSGIDTFTYHVKETETLEKYNSNTATVTINVIERPEADYFIFLPLILK